MTSSNSAKVHPKAASAAVGCMVAALLMAGCTPSPDSPSGGSSGPTGQPGGSSQETGSTPSATSTEQVGKDGRTVEPSTAADSCSILPEEKIRGALGSWAATLQPGQGEVSTDREGVAVDACVYPLNVQSGTNNSIVVELRDYPTPDKLQAAAPFSLLMNPEPVSGLRGDAKFGVNNLAGSTEYGIVSVSGARASRLLLSGPEGQPLPDPAEAKRLMTALAAEAGF
jgi:hypothetical protein